jgi:hypothetical protein
MTFAGSHRIMPWLLTSLAITAPYLFATRACRSPRSQRPLIPGTDVQKTKRIQYLGAAAAQKVPVHLRSVHVEFGVFRGGPRMTKPIARDPVYRRRSFDADFIELCVR